MRFRTTRIALTLAVATMLGVTGLIGFGAASASAATATKSPITIALVCTCSGPGGPEYQGVPGAFRARIDLQNANGGVNGHKISTLVWTIRPVPRKLPQPSRKPYRKGSYGIVSISALFFEGAKYAQQADIPVTGSFQDGPEWGQQPYTNMFASDNGSLDPKYPVNTGIGKFLVSEGGKRRRLLRLRDLAIVHPLGYRYRPVGDPRRRQARRP